MAVPVKESNSKVQKKLAKEISDGVYNIGVLITPQEFRATKLKDGELRKEIFSVYGRKMQLLDIRKEMLKKHKEFLRLRNDEEYGQMIREIIIDGLIRINEFSIGLIDATREVLLNKLVSFERTRHLMFWHDGSSLDNHSHILMTVGVMMSLFKNITKQFIIYKQLLKNHFFIF